MNTNIVTSPSQDGYAPRLSRRDLLRKAGGAALALAAGGAAVVAAKPAAADPYPPELLPHIRRAARTAMDLRRNFGLKSKQVPTAAHTRRLIAMHEARLKVRREEGRSRCYDLGGRLLVIIPPAPTQEAEDASLVYFVGQLLCAGPEHMEQVGCAEGTAGLSAEDVCRIFDGQHEVSKAFRAVWFAEGGLG